MDACRIVIGGGDAVFWCGGSWTWMIELRGVRWERGNRGMVWENRELRLMGQQEMNFERWMLGARQRGCCEILAELVGSERVGVGELSEKTGRACMWEGMEL